ncbi:hypothetical protein O181_071815 [Austropuccinia psidii MF-1]|uniref:Pentatricopeptide repeat-containing protein n=1 Tax=Austropuccinia psidii MF-1 TaxID=1389203 RepID=A0A9Q3F7F9_9BASI|nr:hypothetical protein [Austropuccinia psidii MF-1]
MIPNRSQRLRSIISDFTFKSISASNYSALSSSASASASDLGNEHSYLNRPSASRDDKKSSNKLKFKRNYRYRSKDPFRYLFDPSSSTQQNHQNHPIDSDPVSSVLEKFKKPNSVISTSQIMDNVMQKSIQNSNILPSAFVLQDSSFSPSQIHPSNHLTSIGKIILNDSDSTHLLNNWIQIYLRYLNLSSNPVEFAHRIRNLLSKRLPKRWSEQLIHHHTLNQNLVSVHSYNELIAFSYRSERYHQARHLIHEMDQRGIQKNQLTHHLICCSYHALSKSKGLQLSFQTLKLNHHHITPKLWISLFSIRPRNPKKLRHLDLMNQASSYFHSNHQNHSNISTMPISTFLDGWKWGIDQLQKNGWALVTLSKRLMEIGKWNLAHELVDTLLTLDKPKKSNLKSNSHLLHISPYWATSLFNALVFGLYNAKQASKLKSSSSSNHSFNDLSNQNSINHSNKLNHATSIDPIQFDSPIPCIFNFVESFIKKHPHHQIQLTPSLLLNCLRIKPCLSPSEIQNVLSTWTQILGMKLNTLGSRLGVRLAHVMFEWFASSIKSYKSNLKLHSIVQQQTQLDELSTQHKILIDLWNGTSKSKISLKYMILKGPIDGKLIRGKNSFYASHQFQSIKLALKKLSNINKKLLKLKPELNHLDHFDQSKQDPFKRFLIDHGKISNQNSSNDHTHQLNPSNPFLDDSLQNQKMNWNKKLIFQFLNTPQNHSIKSLNNNSNNPSSNCIKALHCCYSERPGLKPIYLKANQI